MPNIRYEGIRCSFAKVASSVSQNSDIVLIEELLNLLKKKHNTYTHLSLIP